MTTQAISSPSGRNILRASPAAHDALEARLQPNRPTMQRGDLAPGLVPMQFLSSAAAVRLGMRDLRTGETPKPLIDLSGYHFVDKVRPDGQRLRVEIAGSLIIPEKLAPGGMELPPLHVPSLSFICFGDSGKGTSAQKEIAEQLVRMGKERGVTFGVHTGDIFYPHGISGASDPNVQRLYTDLYKGLPNIHATLGNHDYGHIDGAGMPESISEAANAGVAGFELGQRYYSRRVICGDTSVRLIMLDTSTVSVDIGQINWLRAQLEKDDTTYNIVVGHHPVHNNGWHGSTDIMKKLLLPLLDAKADAYLCGHEHNQQELFTDNGLPVVLSGAAAEARPTWPGGHAHWTSVRRGAAYLKIDANGIHCDFLSAYKDRVLHSDTYKRRERKPLPPPITGARPLPMPLPPKGYFKAVCDMGPMLSARADKALP